ncbi:MAG: DUF1232 domain-containing protein [Gammaproteobacteria bacterium]|nr:DUF1232 domain-containing protein [Gammaproteobacteria bacterium]
MNSSFNENSFWKKLAAVAKSLGREIIEKILWLYYAAQRPDVPIWAKTTIYSALAYFVLPLDLIPDFLPGGYVDDMSVLAAAVTSVASYINDEVKRQTAVKMRDWFGD